MIAKGTMEIFSARRLDVYAADYFGIKDSIHKKYDRSLRV